jgi:hypothetical protein
MFVLSFSKEGFVLLERSYILKKDDRKKFHERRAEKREQKWMESTEITKHHVFSRKLFFWLKNLKWNKNNLPRNLHTAYHALFNHLSPERIARYLQVIFSRHLAFLILQELNEKIWKGLFKIEEEKERIRITLREPFKSEAEAAEAKAEHRK